MRVSLSDNEITSKGASLLFDCLKANDNSITYINLGSNMIDNRCIESLGEYVKISNSITKIDIGYNMISDLGIKLLAPYLSINNSITHLFLQGNENITSKSIPVLLKIIETTRLEEIEIRNVSIVKSNPLMLPLAHNVIKYASNELDLRFK